MKKLLLTFLLLALVATGLSVTVLAERKDSGYYAPKATASAKAKENNNSLKLVNGYSYRFKGHEEGNTYSSSDSNIASVSATGEILTHNVGSCTLTKKINDRNVIYNITVSGGVDPLAVPAPAVPAPAVPAPAVPAPAVPATSVPAPAVPAPANPKSSNTFSVGDSYNFPDHQEGVTYGSTNPKAASVDENGKIIALSPGTSEVSRTHGEYVITYNITVVDAENVTVDSTVSDTDAVATSPSK